MRLIVLIPALDEEADIADVVAGVPRSIPGIDDVRIIVIDDGSTDRTAERARAAGATVVSHGTNRGVGVAFRTGVQQALAAGADIAVNMDGDGQFDAAGIPALIRPILDDEADFVTCTRFRDRALRPRMPLVKRLGNAAVTRLVNRIAWGAEFTDVSCGFRAYSRDALLRLNLFGDYTYTQETFINLAGQHVRMREVALAVRGTRAHGQSRVAGSVWRYAAQTLPIMLRTWRDHRPLVFFGSMGLVVLALGVALGGFVFVHWLRTGFTSPYRSLLLGSVGGIVIGCLMLFAALMADMLNRLRLTLEEILYLERRRGRGSGGSGGGSGSGSGSGGGGGGGGSGPAGSR